ncbi:hypothetical protein [Streptomyces sp. NPDC058867]|uniref:hypothetical protein n=1 Tax=unclassified Streptomyces TaxID=2593676 RepID=UPI0036C471A1
MLAVLLTPVSVIATWVNSQVNDVDRYVQTVSPLARDPAVQNLLTDRVTESLVKEIDVRAITDALADTLDARDAPDFLVKAAREWDEQLKDGLTAGIRLGVEKVVTSAAFAQAWDSINRGAHNAATNILTGDGNGALAVKGDTITLNVGAVIDQLQKQLIGTTLVPADSIPGADKSIVLVRNENLSEAQAGARWLGALGPWLPLTLVVLGGLGVWAAPNRRIALVAGAIGAGVMLCGLLIALTVARQICLNAVTGAEAQQAAAAAYDTLVRFLRQAALTALVTALIVAIAGYLCGPGRGAVATRSAASRGTESAGRALARAGMTTGPVGPWLRTHRPLTTGVVIGAGGLILLLWNYPTPGAVALLLLLVLVVLAILGILGAADEKDRRLRPPAPRHRAPGPPAPALRPRPSGPGAPDLSRADAGRRLSAARPRPAP